MEKDFTKTQILEFVETDWSFERQSGYAGMRNVKFDSAEYGDWIYEEEYNDRIALKKRYEEQYKLISDFRHDYLPFGKYPDYVIQEFLDKKFKFIL